MSLSAGMRLGPYEVLCPLGAGGMGEVWRARDTRLERDVAVKVLPDEDASDPRALAQFESESRAIAALSHPNILAIHDVGESNGVRYAVTELLQGQTLRLALAAGPLPVRRALHIAAQIADALAAVHENGFVHEDLKPENVFVGPDGHVKLFDFGIARRYQRRDPDGARPPPVGDPSTPERVPGTVAYMSPEQAQGFPVDYRSDQFSCAIVLYEMLAGRRPFRGGSVAETLSAIIKDEPEPLEKSAPGIPGPVRWCIERCLAKEPADRYSSTHDLARDLACFREHMSDVEHGGAATGPVERRRAGRRTLAAGIGLMAAGVLLAAFGGLRLMAPATPRPQVVRSLLDVSPAEEVAAGPAVTPRHTPGGPRTAMAWAPDGRTLVFIGSRGGVRKIYVRALEGLTARPLEGTEGAITLAISPDGKWVAFWAGDAIRRVPLVGGPAVTLLDGRLAGLPGLGWGEDGRLFYEDARATISSVESGHAPAAVTTLVDETSHTHPHPLPGGRALLYTARHRTWTWGDEEVVVHVLASGERKVLVKNAADARYVAPGFLVFLRQGTLFGVRFDLSRLEVRGTAAPILEHVAQALSGLVSGDFNGSGQFAVSSSGSLAYIPGAATPRLESDLVTIDRLGRVKTVGVPRRGYLPFLALSPDGRQLVFGTQTLTEQALWSHDLRSGKSSKLPGGGEFAWPRWMPDGQRLSFLWLSQDVSRLAWQRTDGAFGPEGLLLEDSSPSSWSPDGRHLAVARDEDIWIGTLEGGTMTMAPFLKTPESEWWPEFSPDGRWLAYGSDATGRWEVYVQPFPGPGPRHLVSLDGGESPAWSPTGRELFFLSLPDSEGKRRMRAVEIGTGSLFSARKPRSLFTFSQPPLRLRCQPSRCYAVSPDGQRFYATQQAPAVFGPPVTQIQLVQNWVEELKAQVQAAK